MLNEKMFSDAWHDTEESKLCHVWFEEYEPSEDTNAEVIFPYASKLWDEAVAAKKRIEDKADSILKFAGTLGGGLAVLSINPIVARHAICLYLSIGLLVASSFFAVAAMRSMKWPVPMSIKDCLEFYGDKKESVQKAQLAASFYVAVVGAKCLLARRSAILTVAYAFAMAGMAALSLLLFPLTSNAV